MMKVILETRRLNKIDTSNCLRTSDCSQGLNHRSSQRIPGWNANIVFPIDEGVILEEQKLTIIPKHLSSPPVFSGVRVARSLAF
jgi:hypothetical protein